EGFAGTTALFGPEVWLPLGMFDAVVTDVFKNKGTSLSDRSNHPLFVAGRLKPGLTADAADARLEAISRRLENAYPADNRGLVIGAWTMRALIASMAAVLPLPLHIDPRPDLNVLLAATAFTVGSTLMFGLAPALKMSRLDVVTDLKDLGGDGAPAARFGTRA